MRYYTCGGGARQEKLNCDILIYCVDTLSPSPCQTYDVHNPKEDVGSVKDELCSLSACLLWRTGAFFGSPVSRVAFERHLERHEMSHEMGAYSPSRRGFLLHASNATSEFSASLRAEYPRRSGNSLLLVLPQVPLRRSAQIGPKECACRFDRLLQEIVFGIVCAQSKRESDGRRVPCMPLM